jgi:hypothetical protein
VATSNDLTPTACSDQGKSEAAMDDEAHLQVVDDEYISSSTLDVPVLTD